MTSEKKSKPRRVQNAAALGAIAALASFLNIYRIWQDETGNAYYTAAVTSMLQSFKAFFFASLDAGGFVTIDKPPVTFWVQTLFAAVFGVRGWSVILPQALAGVGSVLLMHALVRPTFGRAAGLISALVMAVTPIAVAVARTNNVDALLVFTLLLAAWMLMKATTGGKRGWLFGAFAMIGVAFNEKMLEAFMVLPAFYLFSALGLRAGWLKIIKLLAASTAVLAAVSLSWPLAVDLTPADSRPYVGSSQTNSVLELAFGYNGISRLTGEGKGVPGSDGSGSAFNIGSQGPLRLFQRELSGQISWLLPFALFGAVSLLTGIRRGKPLSRRVKETLFWSAWLVPVMGFVSVAGFFHEYYLIMLAPPIAALCGAGWSRMFGLRKNAAGWQKLLLPVALIATAVFELSVLASYRTLIGTGWQVAVGAGALGAIAAMTMPGGGRPLLKGSAIAAMCVLLAAPLYWSATPLLYGGNSKLPVAGPGLRSSNSVEGDDQGAASQVDQALYKYLSDRNTGETYLFATDNVSTAESYIIATGSAVMAMGGYSGNDPILTPERLAQLVRDEEVKYFLIGNGGRGGGSTTSVSDWIVANGREIAAGEWAQNGQARINGKLYEVTLPT
ncbi:glycosyltransferase family 39 protein [Cohnella sp. GCM10012308]|uniref:glycosyltransferase family 39 protein n=1 Tax=Cohnella sp. GCM10012308 TaxID=3317329 RepID=UPI003614E364